MYKIDRINKELKKLIVPIIDRELKNPNIDGIITITKVDTTPDLSLAKIKVSISYNNIETDKILSALNHSGGFIRNQLKTRVNMRNIPKLIFSIDTGYENAMRIEKVLSEINKDKNE